MLISMGDQEERAAKHVAQWLLEAEGKGIPVVLKYHTGAATAEIRRLRFVIFVSFVV